MAREPLPPNGPLDYGEFPRDPAARSPSWTQLGFRSQLRAPSLPAAGDLGSFAARVRTYHRDVRPGAWFPYRLGRLGRSAGS